MFLAIKKVLQTLDAFKTDIYLSYDRQDCHNDQLSVIWASGNVQTHAAILNV